MSTTTSDTGVRRLRDLLAAAFAEAIGISTSPFRRIRQRRVEHHLDRRLQVFTALDPFPPEETERLRPLVVDTERALSGVDFWHEVCSIPTVLPYLLWLGSLWLVVDEAFADATELHAGPLTLLVPVLAYFVGMVVMWRIVRRLLPAPRFDIVGSRKYRDRPWRVLSSMVLLFATGVAAYHIEGWGLRIQSDWDYLVWYTGTGLLDGVGVAGMWVVSRMVSTVGTWLLQYAVSFRHPGAVIADNYLAMLYELHELDVNDKALESSPASRRRLLDLLEVSARCTEVGLRRDLRGLDPDTDEWVRTRTSEMATAVRMLKKDVISGGKEAQDKLYGRLRNA